MLLLYACRYHQYLVLQTRQATYPQNLAAWRQVVHGFFFRFRLSFVELNFLFGGGRAEGQSAGQSICRHARDQLQ